MALLMWLFAAGTAVRAVAGPATMNDTAGQDLYVDSTDPGQGSSVPGQTVVYAGPDAVIAGSSTFDNVYVGYKGSGTVTQASGDLTINHEIYFAYSPGSSGSYLLRGGTLTLGFSSDVSYYGAGNFAQTGGIFTVNGQSFSIGGNAGSTGTYTLGGGSLIAVNVNVGGGGSATFTQTAGSFTCNALSINGYPNISAASRGSYRLGGTGTLSTTGNGLTNAVVGGYGPGTFVQDGGRFTTNGNKLSIGDGSSAGNYTLSDGSLFTGSTYVSNGGSADTFEQSGGLHFTNGVQLTDGKSAYSLDGGTLKAAKVFAYKTVITYIGGSQTSTSFPVSKIVPGAGTFNFNGGTLQNSGGTPPYDESGQTGFLTGIAQANVRDGGAIIDTQTFDTAANQVFSHSAIAGDAATDGGLTKLGNGTLTLAAASTYTGPTTVSTGTLAVTVNGGLGKGDTNVAAGATLSVGSGVIAAHNESPGTTLTLADAATSQVNLAGRGVQDTVAALVINGAAQPPGTYGAPSSGAKYTNVVNFTGTGQLWVAPNGAPHPHFFDGEVALSGGAYYLPFASGQPFGYYSFLSQPNYLYHFDLGYEYLFDANDGKAGIYFYDFASNDFFYTSPNFPFPYLYSFNLKAVLYYYPDPNNPDRYNTNGTRYFYNFATGQIISY